MHNRSEKINCSHEIDLFIEHLIFQILYPFLLSATGLGIMQQHVHLVIQQVLILADLSNNLAQKILFTPK